MGLCVYDNNTEVWDTNKENNVILVPVHHLESSVLCWGMLSTDATHFSWQVIVRCSGRRKDATMEINFKKENEETKESTTPFNLRNNTIMSIFFSLLDTSF